MRCCVQELARAKDAAVAAEDYDEAKRIKAAIERLKVSSLPMIWCCIDAVPATATGPVHAQWRLAWNLPGMLNCVSTCDASSSL